MNSHEFVEAIKLYVRDSAVEGTIETYTKPPGRSPRKELVEVSDWYNSLDENGKAMVKRIIRRSVDSGIFGFFCVLDGVRLIDDRDNRGEFKLLYLGKEGEVLLNDINQELLHDLFNE